MNKAEILQICARCPGAWTAGCWISDIEACRDENIHPPKCQHFPPPIDEEKTVSIDENPYIHRRETNDGVRYPSEVSKSSIGGIFPLDSLDLKILNFLSIHHYERSISRITGSPRVTIQKRIKRLKEMGLIQPEEGNRHIKFYALTPSGIQFLVHDEEGTRKQEGKSPFTFHCSKWSFPLISGLQPKSKHQVKMRNWTGYDFKENPLYTVRTTPRAVHVFVNIELSGASVENLNEKYKALAIDYAGKFAEDHGLKLGAPKPYQKPDFTLKNNSLAKIISEVGNVRTSDIHIDRSRSSGDLEMDYEAAKGFEFVVAQMPQIVAGLRAEIANLKISHMQDVAGLKTDISVMIESTKSLMNSIKELFPKQQGKDKEEPAGYQ